MRAEGVGVDEGEMEVEVDQHDVAASAWNRVQVVARRVFGEAVVPGAETVKRLAVRVPGDAGVAGRLEAVDGVVVGAFLLLGALGDTLEVSEQLRNRTEKGRGLPHADAPAHHEDALLADSSKSSSYK